MLTAPIMWILLCVNNNQQLWYYVFVVYIVFRWNNSVKEEYFPYASYIDIKNLATNINDIIFMTIKAIFITVTEVISILVGLFTQLFQCWYFNILKKNTEGFTCRGCFLNKMTCDAGFIVVWWKILILKRRACTVPSVWRVRSGRFI